MTCSGARATAGSATAASRLAVNWPSRSASGSDACTNTRSPSAAGTRNGSIPTGGNRPPAQVCRRQHEPIPRRCRRRGQATDAAEPPPAPGRTHPCQNRCGAAFGIGVRPPPHLQHGLGDRQFAQGLGVAQHIAPVRAAQAQCPARREFAKERSEQIDGVGWAACCDGCGLAVERGDSGPPPLVKPGVRQRGLDSSITSNRKQAYEAARETNPRCSSRDIWDWARHERARPHLRDQQATEVIACWSLLSFWRHLS